jgi:hypothetical protein
MRMKNRAVGIAANSMYGLRLPQRDFVRSLMTPINGLFIPSQILANFTIVAAAMGDIPAQSVKKNIIYIEMIV